MLQLFNATIIKSPNKRINNYSTEQLTITTNSASVVAAIEVLAC